MRAAHRRVKMKGVNVRRLSVSFWSCISFIGLGASLVVFAPTLLDIAHQLDVGVGLLSVMFLVRAAGGVLGTMVSGVLLDKFPRRQYALLCVVLFARILATAAIPFSFHLAMLAAGMFLMGLTFGGLNNSVHAILMRLWGKKCGPCLQFLHAAFALGAFLAPLIAKPFITDIPDTLVEDLNTSLVFNVSCGQGSMQASNCKQPNPLSCIYDANNGTSNKAVQLPSNCSVEEIGVEPVASHLKFGWAYWISATFLVMPLFVFVYFTLRQSKSTSKHNESGESLMKVANNTTGDRDSPLLVQRTYKYPALLILFCFMFCYIGLEVSYGSLLFTFAVKSKLQFDKQTAAVLTALFWGMFAFARLFSVLLAVLKVRASVMMALNVSGSALAVPILAIFPHNRIAIWLASGLLGASFASIYPTTMTWLSHHIPVTGKATGIVVAGGNLGDILLPSAIAALIGNVSPDSFVYSMVALIVCSTLLVVVLFTVTAIYQKRQDLVLDKCSQYCKLEESKDSSSSDQDDL